MTLPTPVLVAVGIILAFLVLAASGAGLAARVAESRKEVERRREQERARLARERSAAAKRERQAAELQKKRDVERRAAALAAAQRRLEEQGRTEEKRLIGKYGKPGAMAVMKAKSSVQLLMATEAASTGWLGDVDFASDLEEIEDHFRRIVALRIMVAELTALPKPNSDDRKILADAKATTSRLERKADERVKLLEQCASEARHIEDSLQQERDDARLAAAREKLHGDLAAMIYGAESTAPSSSESGADAVIARVQAYREIKGELERARVDVNAVDSDKNDSSHDSSASGISSSLRGAWKWITE
ncbi:hypothetical protein [Mycolicibacterium sp. P1-18]|uniref:hypothetical protein n=1 Tax=Mycolicibacterium sp. P1-18 TaxID=2024615 RepID=UPI0011F1BAD5|nr:hypothetical protein [Mycolicibacterium sp. P1-18]